MKLIAEKTSRSTSALASNGVEKAKRQAKKAAEEADNEKENQVKLAAATKERLQSQNSRYSDAPLTTPPERKRVPKSGRPREA